MTLLAFNKPYGVLCQFTDSDHRPTLADFISIAGVYPAGRLDRDSEGLLLLTDDGALQARIAQPESTQWKRYLVQVENIPDSTALERLRTGVVIEGIRTRPAKAEQVQTPTNLWPRDPPIRVRQHIPTAWLEIQIHEGRNRQVRKMTAAVGHPTLRLVRVAIGSINLGSLLPGQWQELDPAVLVQECVPKGNMAKRLRP
jgi:23S rRNA pseudouridine2457 synthase